MKRTYQKPHTSVAEIAVRHIIALSGGEQTTGRVNDPTIEVDAGNALTKRNRNTLWDDWDEEW